MSPNTNAKGKKLRHDDEKNTGRRRSRGESRGNNSGPGPGPGSDSSGLHHEACAWDPDRWAGEGDPRLRKGFKNVKDPRYLLRPEAIESVFLLYRMTGKEDLLDVAWRMFQATVNATQTPHGNAAIDDVTVPQGATNKIDSMEVTSCPS